MSPWMIALLGALALPVVAWFGLRALWLGFARARYVAYLRHKGLAIPAPSVVDHLRDEWANTRLAVWRMLPNREEPWTPDPVTGPPVVLVHGFVGRASDFRVLRQRLHDAGRPTLAPDLGWSFRGVASYTPPLEPALEAAARLGDGRLDVVAHSMGGLVLRAALAQRPDLAARVGHVVTLGAPHAGTASTRGLPAGRPPDLDDLRRSSAFLEDLPDLDELVPRATVLTVAGTHDMVVYPPGTCRAPGAEHVELPVGHSELLMASPVVEQVLEALTPGA